MSKTLKKGGRKATQKRQPRVKQKRRARMLVLREDDDPLFTRELEKAEKVVEILRFSLTQSDVDVLEGEYQGRPAYFFLLPADAEAENVSELAAAAYALLAVFENYIVGSQKCCLPWDVGRMLQSVSWQSGPVFFESREIAVQAMNVIRESLEVPTKLITTWREGAKRYMIGLELLDEAEEFEEPDMDYSLGICATFLDLDSSFGGTAGRLKEAIVQGKGGAA